VNSFAGREFGGDMDMGGMGDQPFDFGEALGAIEGESLEERVAREHAEGIAVREGAFAGQRVRASSLSISLGSGRY